MSKKNKKGFTLIELVAVLVIMAIIALIVTPLVMNIIRKAKIAADKRSVDAYGRSVELAIANYLLDNGDFPTEISQLTIEYSGDRVECSTTQLNSDSSVYLAGCTVAGRNVENYTYGSDKSPTYTAYTVGNQVTYNNVNYYVIKDSGAKESTVTLLKAEPLSVAEVNQFGAGHVNMNVQSSESYYQTAYNQNSYGGMQYYSSSTCGYNGTDWVFDGCKNDYASSEIKYVVDAWKTAKAPAATEARLMTFEDLTGDLGFELQQVNPSLQGYKYTENTPSWVYNSNYRYWTSTRYNDSSSDVWSVDYTGVLGSDSVSNFGIGCNNGVVRPAMFFKWSLTTGE